MAIYSINGGAGSPVAGAIREAAQSTGTSFEYLLTTAQIESNLNPAAQATTSSAKGLYQFIEQTWLATMKNAGPSLGFARYAAAIVQGPDGQYAVPDAAARAAIMRLRSDPAASATLAGAFTRNNAAQLNSAIGRAPSEGELYIAHFLGADGAAKLIGAATSQPRANAAAMFPAAAAANPRIFYDRSGRPLAVGAVYGRLTGRYDVARALAFAPGSRAAAVAPAQDTAGVAQAYAQARNQAPVPDNRPLFQAMFTDRPQGGLSPAVNTLWGAAQQQPANQPSGLLELFRDPTPGLRKSLGGKV
jgi:Transglycosylase SLT domain